MFGVDAKMDEICGLFQGKWLQKSLPIDLHWIRNNWYMHFSPKILKFLQGAIGSESFTRWLIRCKQAREKAREGESERVIKGKSEQVYHSLSHVSLSLCHNWFSQSHHSPTLLSRSHLSPTLLSWSHLSHTLLSQSCLSCAFLSQSYLTLLVTSQ